MQDAETGKIKSVSPDEYDPSSQVALTNQDLINYRRENPSMAFQSDILDNLASAVGMKSITDYARNIIKDFGKTTITGYGQKQNDEIQIGMDQIVTGDAGPIQSLISRGPDGIYKLSQQATVADLHLDAALNYILQTLPKGYYNTLVAKAAAEGYNPQAMLLAMLQANTDRSITADYDHTATEDAALGIEGIKAAKLDDHDTYLMRIAVGGE